MTMRAQTCVQRPTQKARSARAARAIQGCSHGTVRRIARVLEPARSHPRAASALASDFNAVSGAHPEPPAAGVSLGHCSLSLFTLALPPPLHSNGLTSNLPSPLSAAPPALRRPASAIRTTPCEK